MRLRYFLLAIAISLCSAFGSIGLHAQIQDDETGILVYSQWIGEGQKALFSISLDGDVEQFSNQTLGYWQTYLSPNQSHLSARDVNGDMVVIDTDGEVVSKFQFSSNGDEQELWHIWGWKTENSLVVSQYADGFLKFYEIDFTPIEPTITLLPALNNTFIWSIDRLEDCMSPLDFRRFIVFASDFSIFVTPNLSTDPNPMCDDFDDQGMVWDLADESSQLLQGSTSLWFLAQPSWSHQGYELVYPVFGSQGRDLFLYTPKQTYPLVTCTGFCGMGVFAWSPSDSQIAYWLDDQYKSHLQVVDRATGEQTTIFSGDFHLTPIFWSHDERYIAILDTDRDDRDNDLSYLNIIEAETGEVVYKTVTGRGNRLVGWLNAVDD